MREVTTTTKVYTYDELSDDAKQHVREWWSRVQWEDGTAQESMSMIWEDTLTQAGWTDLSDLTYSDLYSQGSGPVWSGTLPGFVHDGVTYTLTVRNRRGGGSIQYFDVALDREDGEDDEDTYYGTPEWDAIVKRTEEIERAAKDHVLSLAHDLFWKFRAEAEYLSDDEQVREACEANGYEFTERGDLA